MCTKLQKVSTKRGQFLRYWILWAGTEQRLIKICCVATCGCYGNKAKKVTMPLVLAVETIFPDALRPYAIHRNTAVLTLVKDALLRRLKKHLRNQLCFHRIMLGFIVRQWIPEMCSTVSECQNASKGYHFSILFLWRNWYQATPKAINHSTLLGAQWCRGGDDADPRRGIVALKPCISGRDVLDFLH